MFKLIVASLVVAVVFAGPVEFRILKQDQIVNPEGTYQYIYETENGIAAQEQGGLKQIGNDVGNSATGSYAYTSPEGVPIQIRYVADENGFRAEGNAVHPIPESVLRTLEWNAAHPEEEQEDYRIPYRPPYRIVKK